MDVTSPTSWLIPLALGLLPVAMRSIGLAWTAPGWATPGLSWRIRLALAATLTLIVAPALTPSSPLNPPSGSDWFPLLGSSLVELSLGAALGYSAALVIAAARQAGDLIGVQAGLSVASLLDPESSEGATALGHLYALMALALFLALDGPLALIDALAASFQAIPPALTWHPPTAETASLIFSRIGWALGLTLRAAAPAALAVALAGLAIGWIARSASGSPLGGMVWPIRSVVGILIVWLGLGSLALWITGAWSEWLALAHTLP